MAAVDTATKHLKDNRTVVGGLDDAGAQIAILPTLPDGLGFDAKDAAGGDVTGEVVATATVPAYVPGAAATVTVPIDFATVDAHGASKYVRKQFFKSKIGDPSTGKWCYTNIHGAPLKADGTPANRDLSDAADASNTPLTAVGEAVTNFAQPGPLPGTYGVSPRQQGYARFLGWTCQSDF